MNLSAVTPHPRRWLVGESLPNHAEIFRKPRFAQRPAEPTEHSPSVSRLRACSESPAHAGCSASSPCSRSPAGGSPPGHCGSSEALCLKIPLGRACQKPARGIRRGIDTCRGRDGYRLRLSFRFVRRRSGVCRRSTNSPDVIDHSSSHFRQHHFSVTVCPATMVSACSVPIASQNLHCSGTRNLSSVSGTVTRTAQEVPRTQMRPKSRQHNGLTPRIPIDAQAKLRRNCRQTAA